MEAWQALQQKKLIPEVQTSNPSFTVPTLHSIADMGVCIVGWSMSSTGACRGTFQFTPFQLHWKRL
eukprot:2612607-Amphidinium_carterae.1